MTKLRVAVIGAGHLGRFHARILAGMPDIELAGIVDPIEGSRQQLATEYQTRAFADHRQIVGLADAAVLAAPTRLHFQVGKDLLQAGLHLLIEKPLASTLAEAEQLVRLADDRRLTLQVGHIERFNPAFAAILPHVWHPKYIEASRFSGYTGRSTDIGVVLDLMIHDIDLVLSMVKSPLVHVEALGISVLGRHEDAANARLTFQNGCVVTLNASRVSYQPMRKMQIWSAGGFAGLDFATRTATILRPAQQVSQRLVDVDAMSPAERGRLKDHLFEDHFSREEIKAEPCDALTAELQDFVGSIRDARPPRVSGPEARDAVAVAEQVLSKIASHNWNGATPGPRGALAMLGATSSLDGPHWAKKAGVLTPQSRLAD